MAAEKKKEIHLRDINVMNQGRWHLKPMNKTSQKPVSSYKSYFTVEVTARSYTSWSPSISRRYHGGTVSVLKINGCPFWTTLCYQKKHILFIRVWVFFSPQIMVLMLSHWKKALFLIQHSTNKYLKFTCFPTRNQP